MNDEHKIFELYLEMAAKKNQPQMIERADGTRAWYLHDKLHREDGAAYEHANGTKNEHGICTANGIVKMVQLMKVLMAPNNGICTTNGIVKMVLPLNGLMAPEHGICMDYGMKMLKHGLKHC
jgi:hypothetical protein